MWEHDCSARQALRFNFEVHRTPEWSRRKKRHVIQPSDIDVSVEKGRSNRLY